MSDEPTPDDAAPEPPGSRPTRPVGRLVRIGLTVLGVFGALSLALGLTTATNPDRGVCSQARSILEDEIEDLDAGEIPCDEAIARAEALRAEDEDVAEVPSESTIRTFGMIVGASGVVQLFGAIMTLRYHTKRARFIALLGAAFGIVFSPLGLLGIPVLGFVVYAIFFSADARAIFGEPGGPRLFRPRPRPNP